MKNRTNMQNKVPQLLNGNACFRSRFSGEDFDDDRVEKLKKDGKRKAWYISWDTDPEPFERWLLPDSSQR